MEYNGWTNYATWRVNLELFDDFCFDGYSFDDETNPRIVADELRDIAIDSVVGDQQGLMAAYAISFMQEVNWVEIASHLIEQRDQ